jgi:hypothetical protein
MVTDWLSPTTAANANITSFGEAWANPTNALANDDTLAQCVLGLAQASRDLMLGGFNAGIPSGAHIHGIECRVRAKKTGAAQLFVGLLAYNGDVLLGSSANAQELTDAEAVYESGLLSHVLSSAIVNHASFGPLITADTLAGGTAQVDHVEMRVHYSPRGSRPLMGV